MLICELDNIIGPSKVPTRESIERDRQRQLQAVKDLRRRLREVLLTAR
jgi:hypothetical protein